MGWGPRSASSPAPRPELIEPVTTDRAERVKIVDGVDELTNIQGAEGARGYIPVDLPYLAAIIKAALPDDDPHN